MTENISWSEFRRLQASKGNDDWWIDQEAETNGIGPVCLFCNKLIDWAPRDHTPICPVRKFFRFEDEEITPPYGEEGY